MVKLSVLVTFCNQKEYVGRALDSILMQKTDFDYEVLIGLDGADDGSEEIIRQYMDKYDFIRLYKMSFSKMDTINIEKASLNRKALLEKATGEFFTILDGDDFYGDERKFQKQIEVLNKYPKCIGCGCSHKVCFSNGKIEDKRSFPYFIIYQLSDYIRKKVYVHNGAIIFRNIFYFGFPLDFPHNFVNDTTLTMYMMKFGQLACLPDSMYMYYVYSGGIYQGVSSADKDLYGAVAAEVNLRCLPEYRAELLQKYHELFCKVYHNRKKYKRKELAVVRDFAVRNGCRFVKAVLDCAVGGFFGKRIARYRCKHMLKHNDFVGQTKVRNMGCFTVFSNFGDMLNLYIARYVYGWNVLPVWENVDVWCIGSVLARLFEDEVEQGKVVDVVGTGLHRELSKPENFSTKVRVHSLRGKLSFEKLSKLLSIKKNIVLADPGILVRRMADKSKVQNEGRIGVIPHYYDKDSEYLKNIKVPNLKIIKTEDSPIQVMRDILSCKCVLSSSLHGLIVADALGVPNRRIVLSDKIIGGDLKFDDYYSVYFDKAEDAPVTIDLRKETIDEKNIDTIIENYVNLEDKMEEQCKALLKIKIN